MRAAAVCAAALVFTGSAAAALPRHGTLVPGRSLAGIELGQSAASVRRTLGSGYGVCRGCATTTWYFTYRAFGRQGLAVELTRGRVSAVYTLWRPGGWGSAGLRLGAPEALVPGARVGCAGYEARVEDAAAARTAYYVVDAKLWGLGLLRRNADPCR